MLSVSDPSAASNDEWQLFTSEFGFFQSAQVPVPAMPEGIGPALSAGGVVLIQGPIARNISFRTKRRPSTSSSLR